MDPKPNEIASHAKETCKARYGTWILVTVASLVPPQSKGYIEARSIIQEISRTLLFIVEADL